LSLIASAPVFVLQPTNQSVLPGGPTTLNVAVVGSTPYHYQWQINGTNLVANTTKYTSGVTNASLAIVNFLATNVGNYTVVVTNSLGSVTSSVATLSLTPVTAPGFGIAANASFSATSTQPENPYAGVVYVSSQSAYFGTTLNGGANGGGSTYKVTTAGTITREHSFTGGTDGAFPVAPLILARDGSLYGVTYQYGTYSDGALWKELPTSTSITALTQFNGNNGSEPVSGLVQGQGGDNNLYGACNIGGAYGYGTIFRTSTAGVLTNLISFNGTDGAYPSPILVQGPDGYLYGTAENGGIYSSGAGTIFRISTNGAFTVLYNFTGTNDGAVPIAGLTLGNDGNYYGTTLQGGAYNEGTVFQITPAGAFTTLYSFTGGADGAEPWGGLVQASNGNLYGNTQQGGTYGYGTVFQVSLTGSYTTVAELDGYQGSTPEGNLVQGPDGNLYGTAFAGGQAGYGSFFSITNFGALQITGQPLSESVYSGANALFTVATSGSAALSYQWQQNGTNLTNGSGISGATNATLIISNTVAGNAGLYSVIVTNALNSVTSTPALLTVIVSPPLITSQPVGLTNLVGTLAIFSVSATGNAPLLYQWQENGTNLADGGNIAGSATPTLTLTGVTLANSGVYSVIVSNSLLAVSSSNAPLVVVPGNVSTAAFTNVHLFSGGPGDGTSPNSSLIQGKDGNLYGTATSGGANYVGTLFRYSLTGTFTNFYSFVTSLGSFPNGGLVQASNGNFYGSAQQGGANSDGSLFQVTNNATVSLLHSLAGASDGQSPDDSLVLGQDGYFYGTAFEGGAVSKGSVFQLLPNGTVNLLYSFTGAADGANPVAGLVQASDGNLYGTTTAAGANGYGTVFKIGTNGVLTTLVTFNYTNGATPYGGVIQANDGNLYGVTSAGGANGYGTVFQLTTNGSLATLHSFSQTDGAYPDASLTQGVDGNLYGTTYAGGLGGQGTVFQITTNGAFNTLMTFNGFNGAGPEAQLLQASDGNFYGTTYLGGSGYYPSSGGGNGTIFRVTVPTFVSNTITMTPAVVPLAYSATLASKSVAPAGDTLTFVKVSGPAWLNVATNGVLSGTPANTDIGTNLFVVSLADTNGVTLTANMIIAVIADPAPTFLAATITKPSANAGLAYVGSIATNVITAYTNFGDFITFAKVSGPAWLSIATNGILSGTPAPSDAGTNTFVVSASNLGGGSNTASLVIYVSPPTPPVITVPATITVQATNIAGNMVFYTVTATDLVDGAILPTVNPASGSIFPLGTNTVTATATDSFSLSSTNTFRVIVVDTNLPVIVSRPVSVTNYAGTTASFAVVATAYSPLSYQWSFGTNPITGQTNSTLSIPSVGPTNAGSYQVAVTSQGGTTNSLPATLTILYQAPSLAGGQMTFGSNGFQFSFSGPSGQTYQVLASGDVTLPRSQWPVVGTGVFGSTNAVFTDPNATNNPNQYYIIESP
jgi:uncharacterized repeat protein (TIGR03803 family)